MQKGELTNFELSMRIECSFTGDINDTGWKVNQSLQRDL